MTYHSLQSPERTQLYAGTLCRDSNPNLESKYKGSVLRRSEGRGLDGRGGQARPFDVMESAHLMSYSSEVKYHEPKQIIAH